MAAAARAQVHPRPQRAAPRPAPRPRRSPAPRARVAARPRVAGGVLWIVMVAALLAGVVAVNVAALQLNVESQRLDERKDKALTANAAAQSELSSLGAASRIEAAARSMGLVAPSETSYVRPRNRDR
jgi:cell division protein FtsL